MIEGTLHPDFAGVATALRSTLGHRRGGGASVAVVHRGELVVDIWSGARDPDGTPWASDTTVLSWSTTKGVVATAAHRLADQGMLDLDAPVAEYWPEFKAAGKEDVRVANLLDHSAGLHSLRGVVDDAEMLLDWDRTVDALAGAAPRYRPGTRHGYHAVTFGFLVGEVLRRVTGLTVDGVVQREIVEPLGLEGMSIGARGDARAHLATLLAVWPSPARTERFVAHLDRRGWAQPAMDAFMIDGFPEIIESGAVYDAELPALNGCFTARSLAGMYSMMAGGGTRRGMRFLSSEAVALAGAVRTRQRDIVLGWPMRWRLGYHLAATARGVRPHGFGHFGLGGSGAWADPDLDLAVAMTCNRMAGTPVGDQRLLKIGAAAVRAATAR
ncbi:MAG: serine hydrolase domain-containing protein [Acidimicrobiia bacterium]